MDAKGLNKVARDLARGEHLTAKLVAETDIINRLTAGVLKAAANEQVNTKKQGDHGYIAMYKGKTAEVWAKSTYEAQTLAAKHFKAKKSFEVSVMLAEKSDGEEVKHTPDF